jgi:class 3 adenylate cyclase/TolB-like protein
MEQKTTHAQPRPTPKHKLSAIMFTDMTGFSRKMGESERLTLKLLRDHNRIIRFLVRKHHGEIIKSTGDGFLMDFDSAVEAVQCALEAQERLQRYNLGKSEDEHIVVRIGINLGEVRIVDEDLFGDEVNIAARIQTLAEPGGICITRDVYEHVKSKLSIVAVNVGPQELKNITHKVETYKILVPIIGQEAIEIPTMNLSLLAAVEQSHPHLVARKQQSRRTKFSRLLKVFKKHQTSPATGLKPQAGASPNAAKRTWPAKVVRKAAPMLFFSLVLPTAWIVSTTSTGSTTLVASLAQWFSSVSFANTPMGAANINAAEKTIAVLYFENRTKDPRDNWMSIGLAEMLITDLENTTPLRVLGRPRLQDTLKKLGKENVQSMDLKLARTVAENLEADLMLLGTIMRDGEKLRIDAQLYDVQRGEILLAKKAQGESVFNLVDDLAQQLKKHLLPAMRAMI